MKIYLIVTRNGTFVTFGKDENEAKVNFSQEFPNEKIRDIKNQESKSIQVSHLMWDINELEE